MMQYTKYRRKIVSIHHLCTTMSIKANVWIERQVMKGMNKKVHMLRESIFLDSNKQMPSILYFFNSCKTERAAAAAVHRRNDQRVEHIRLYYECRYMFFIQVAICCLLLAFQHQLKGFCLIYHYTQAVDTLSITVKINFFFIKSLIVYHTSCFLYIAVNHFILSETLNKHIDKSI